MGVTAGQDETSFRQGAAIGTTQFCHKFRGQFDIGESADHGPFEQGFFPLFSPDQVSGNDGSGFDEFFRPDFDILLDIGIFADRGVIRDDGALFGDDPLADAHVAADHRVDQLCALFDIDVVPDNATEELGSFFDSTVASDNGVLDARSSEDLGVISEDDGSLQCLEVFDADIGPETDILPEEILFLFFDLDIDFAVKDIVVGLAV